MSNNQLSPFKIPYKPRLPGTGTSSFDWTQLSVPSQTPRRVTLSELALHNTPQDCWTVIQGRVYDISHYLPYHPGGRTQLLRGKGIDATELFMKVHPWVNPEALLRKVWLGFLVRE